MNVKEKFELEICSWNLIFICWTERDKLFEDEQSSRKFYRFPTILRVWASIELLTRHLRVSRFLTNFFCRRPFFVSNRADKQACLSTYTCISQLVFGNGCRSRALKRSRFSFSLLSNIPLFLPLYISISPEWSSRIVPSVISFKEIQIQSVSHPELTSLWFL